MKTLALILLLPAAALADRRFTVAPKVGLYEPTSRLSGALFLGIEAGYVTPAFDDHLAVALEVDWVRPKASGTISDPRVPAGSEYSLGDAEVGALLSAIYRLDRLFPRVTPYFGAGPGLYWHRTATNAFGSQYVETETRIGFQLLGGADVVLGPGAAFGEARYTFSRVDFISTGHSPAGSMLALALGYRVRF